MRLITQEEKEAQFAQLSHPGIQTMVARRGKFLDFRLKPEVIYALKLLAPQERDQFPAEKFVCWGNSAHKLWSPYPIFNAS
jgi:hypothetical protein